jgi:hypothetical protein
MTRLMAGPALAARAVSPLGAQSAVAGQQAGVGVRAQVVVAYTPPPRLRSLPAGDAGRDAVTLTLEASDAHRAFAVWLEMPGDSWRTRLETSWRAVHRHIVRGGPRSADPRHGSDGTRAAIRVVIARTDY